MTKTNKIAIIGAGNIGISLARGLVESKVVQANEITLTRRNTQKIENLVSDGFAVENDNLLAVKSSRFVFIAVKPQQAIDVLREIAPGLKSDWHILVSLVTGLGSAEIMQIVGKDVPIFLAMPNTALAIAESMTCISYQGTNLGAREEVEVLFNRVGKCFFIQEELMGASTVLAACGVAFALRFLRSISQGGVEIGFDASLSTQIAAQTLKGAARLTQESGNHPEYEIDRVTTPLGITISGLNEMEHNGFSSSLIKGLITSFRKIENLKGR